MHLYLQASFVILFYSLSKLILNMNKTPSVLVRAFIDMERYQNQGNSYKKNI